MNVSNMRVAAVMNQKGGVGKTTTTVNMGAILARDFGKKVLLVDIDPQGSLTDHVGLDPYSLEKSVYDVIINNENPATVMQHAHGMDIIPANIDLAGAEVELAHMTVRETRLRNAMRGLCRNYDITLIDCPPSLGLLTLSGLCLATEVLVPLQAEYLAMRGLEQLAHTVGLIHDNLNTQLHIGGIVFCQFNTQARLSHEVRSEVEGYFPGMVYDTNIRRNVRLAESASHGQPTLLYDSDCAGVEDYRALAVEFLRRGGEDIPVPEDEPAEVPGQDTRQDGEGSAANISYVE